MADIVIRIKHLVHGEYLTEKRKARKHAPSARLYREVYENLDTLSMQLQENERKRQEFDKQRQDWAAGVTHDLKTPLSYISGYTDMLLSNQYQWNDAEKIEFLRLIKEKSAYMVELIQDLGIAFRMDQNTVLPFHTEQIELTELIRRVVAETINLPAAKDYDFEILGESKPIFIMGDDGLLKRAFSNLLVNAVVHNPAGTKITVQILKTEQIEICIADDGQGMDEQSVSHLFDRYYRGTSTDMLVGGTGLGMAIVKQIIVAHQGSVEVESKPESGTAIIVRLPWR